MVGHHRDTPWWGTAGISRGVAGWMQKRIRCSWALPGLCDITAGIRGGWALQGYLVVGHHRDMLWLGTTGILSGWALQGYSALGRCKDILRLGIARIIQV